MNAQRMNEYRNLMRDSVHSSNKSSSGTYQVWGAKHQDISLKKEGHAPASMGLTF